MNSGVFLLSAVLLLQGLQVDATEVEVWLHSYQNPDHKLASGTCCYPSCTDCNNRLVVRNSSMRLGAYATGSDDVTFGMQIGNLSNPFTCTTANIIIRIIVRHVLQGADPAEVARFDLVVNENYECCRSYHGQGNTSARIKMSYRTVQATQSSVMDLCECTSSGTNKGTSPALAVGLSALALIIIVLLSGIAVATGLWKVLSKQRQKLESPTKQQPNIRPGHASWHNMVYGSDSPPTIPSGHTQPPPLSASYHEYDLIDQGGATVHIKVKAPPSTEAAEEDYASPADAIHY